MAYSMDFIEAAVAYRQNGHTFKELRETFGIPPETFYQWENRLESGYYEIEKGIQERRRKIDREELRQAVSDTPDMFLYEFAELFDCTPQAIFYMLRKMNITIKKRPIHTLKNQKRNERNSLRD
jgi:transposase